MKLLPFLFLAVASCATSEFTAYEGAQQQWKTAPGAFAKSGYAVPVYYSVPSRPYNVLGYIDATTAPVRRRGVVKFAASKAKEVGGDAIIVISEGSEYAGTFHNASANTNSQATAYMAGNTAYGYGTSTTNLTGSSVPLYKGRAGVIVIKFK